MRLLSAYDIVRICEWGYDKHALDRAVMLLRVAAPDVTPAALSRMPIGRRDALLMSLRAQLFGSRFEMHVPCPRCRERLELDFTLEELRQVPPAQLREVLEHDGFSLRYRLPDSVDLAAVVGERDPARARLRLLERCVLEVRAEAGEVALRAVPGPVLDALAARMAEDDPQADITFRLTCPSCGHGWRAAFDIVSFLWTELEAYVRQVQREVHELAQTYGWSEASILSMSARSRKRYLEMAVGG